MFYPHFCLFYYLLWCLVYKLRLFYYVLKKRLIKFDLFFESILKFDNLTKRYSQCTLYTVTYSESIVIKHFMC